MSALLDTYGAMLLKAIGVHTLYVLVSVAVGFALGLVLGVLLSRVPKWSGVILPIVSVFQTIPGLVFIGVLFLWIGMTPATVIIALAIYAMFPVLKNTYTGILGVERRYVEAAQGCGMSAVYTVSWAVLAAMIGLGGLGDFIYQGTSSNNNTLILLGAIPAAILAIVIGALIDLLQKRVTPRGLRKGAGK